MTRTTARHAATPDTATPRHLFTTAQRFILAIVGIVAGVVVVAGISGSQSAPAAPVAPAAPAATATPAAPVQTSQDEPYCPTEDSCVARYAHGHWTITPIVP